MVATVTTAGNTDIRTYLKNTWRYVALQTPIGDEITRIDVVDDDRASWASGSENPLTATITVKGKQDDIVPSDATGPTDIAATASYRTATGGSQLCVDTDTAVTIEADNDTTVITHRIWYPTNE